MAEPHAKKRKLERKRRAPEKAFVVVCETFSEGQCPETTHVEGVFTSEEAAYEHAFECQLGAYYVFYNGFQIEYPPDGTWKGAFRLLRNNERIAEEGIGRHFRVESCEHSRTTCVKPFARRARAFQAHVDAVSRPRSDSD